MRHVFEHIIVSIGTARTETCMACVMTDTIDFWGGFPFLRDVIVVVLLFVAAVT